ncbi:MAG: sigma 54-interacting transcriptional regulator [Bryobacteraceae bacterium]
MTSTASQTLATRWLAENGPKELESLFRAILIPLSAPILIAGNDGHFHDASIGAGKFLGHPREKIIGRTLNDFAAPATKPLISERWRAFLEQGDQIGSLQLLGPDGAPRDVEYSAKRNVLPARHLLTLRDKTNSAGAEKEPIGMRDYALFLLDVDGRIAAWYAGAERIYHYKSGEATGRHISILYPGEENLRAKIQEELNRAAREGHFGNESWHVRKDGSLIWANAINMALKDADGVLHGFAGIVRDFSDRHGRDEKLRRSRARLRPVPAESAIAGVVSGEFDRIPQANDTFLDLVGYSREDLLDGLLVWPDLTPAEYVAADEFAHEEGLRFGACTPYEKELIRKDGARVPVLVVTAILKLAPLRWIAVITDLRERNRRESVDGEVGETNSGFEEIIGASRAIKHLTAQVEVVAPTDATVLILGETGTGKELVARAIHRLSPRSSRPFITLNCAAIPTGLLESELFGYERGAFTGALSQKIGRFELANHGTLFLDEVGDIPLDLQPKLLRALQEKAFERLGGTRTIPIDVRLVAATNRDLTRLMADKLFRTDLYYRLRVFPIVTPPLREHVDDIPILARHFTRKYAAKMNRKIDSIPTETMTALAGWPWPGNVRELENFIERSVILSRGPGLRAPLSELRAAPAETSGVFTLEEVERDYIAGVLRDTSGVVSAAASRLGVPRTTLNAMIKKLGISRRGL